MKIQLPFKFLSILSFLLLFLVPQKWREKNKTKQEQATENPKMITSDLQKLVGMESGSLGAEKMGTLIKISLT